VAAYRQFWEQRLDRLEAYLQKAQAAANPRKSPHRRKGKTHGRKGK
jgi:hypothetical protein